MSIKAIVSVTVQCPVEIDLSDPNGLSMRTEAIPSITRMIVHGNFDKEAVNTEVQSLMDDAVTAMVLKLAAQRVGTPEGLQYEGILPDDPTTQPPGAA